MEPLGVPRLLLLLLLPLAACSEGVFVPGSPAGSDASSDDITGAGDQGGGGTDALRDAIADPLDDPVSDPPADAALDLEPSDTRDTSSGPVDGSLGDAPPDEGPPPVAGPTRYIAGRVHSLLTPVVVASLRTIAGRDATLRDDVFMKVGDSITIATSFLHCLADPAVDLEGRDDLGETRDFFAEVDDLIPAGGGSPTTPFDRSSMASLGGKTAAWVVTATDSGDAPVVAERDAISPRFAVVMMGTNDIGYWPDDFPRMFRWYGESLLELVDVLVDSGVVPILSTIPPRLDSPSVLDPRVASLNALVWGLAQSEQVPLVDYHLALAPLAPDWGLAGDGVHPSVSCDGGVRCGCRFDATGMLEGYNVRNWITLEALDRVRRSLIDGEPAPDTPERPALEGMGSATQPFVIDALPFADYRDTRDAPSDAIDQYTGCNASQNESGREFFYELDLDRSTPIGAVVADRAGVDIDVHILDDSTDPADCRVRNDAFIEGTLSAGRWVFVLDTWVDGSGTALAGEYLFAVHARE